MQYPYKSNSLIWNNPTLDNIIAVAGSDPDSIDEGTSLIAKGECLIGHIYAPNGIGFADVMVELFYDKAVAVWKAGYENRAYVYLAYASHYFEDAGIPLHAEADYRNLSTLQWQLSYHSATEAWVSDNWETHNFQTVADSAAKVPMPICDIGAAVRSLAMEIYPDIAEWNKAWG